jgi:hypothetical protein
MLGKSISTEKLSSDRTNEGLGTAVRSARQDAREETCFSRGRCTGCHDP